jgi:signal transduction histidine kinase
VRRRLLLSMLAAVSAALVLMGLPLAVAVRGLLVQQTLDALQREAEQAQVLVDQQGRSVGEVALLLTAVAAESGTRLTLVDRTGGFGLQIDTGGPPTDDVFRSVTSDLEAARRGEVGRAVGDGIVAVTVPVRGGGVDQLVRATRTDDALRASVGRAWTQLAALALVALGVAAVVALWLGRRLAEPLEDLAASARELGDGDFSVRAPRSGVPEADDVAAALDATAERLAAILARSRSFSADASHQLRTPLTALRLQLEALEVAPGSSPAVTAAVSDALAEVDRLDATVSELLSLGAPATTREAVDIETLVSERVRAWRALARAQGREIVVQAVPLPPVRARPAAIGQSLQVLLDNALEHGEGTITISMQPVSGGVRLCVADEGPGMPGDLRIESRPADRTGVRGRGLSLARSLVEAEGGHLHVEERAAGAMVCLLLPAAAGEPAEDPGAPSVH